MKKEIATIIVLYNSLISESEAHETLKNPNFDLFFVDNSTDEEILKKNEEYSKKNNVLYYPMGGNIGLSKAYNRIIKEIKKLDYNYLLISDDDTLYTKEFQDLLVDEVKNNKYDLIVPTIIDSRDGVVASPILLTGIPLVPYNPKSKRPPKRINGINSGTCVKVKCFDNWQFDEGIFLYFVDSDFYNNNVNANKLTYKILDCTIKQNFAASEDFDDSTIKLLQRVLDDGRQYFRNKPLSEVQLAIYKFYLVKRLWFQHKDKRVFSLLWY